MIFHQCWRAGAGKKVIRSRSRQTIKKTLKQHRAGAGKRNLYIRLPEPGLF